ncbi:MAG TPA: agmatine deiminase family protein [Paludibacteraceae bacterium]|nr:agmatine deiminase family protein [Paludibacteraceae bacterium]HOU67949.1 agmatine deiminase family protein [Paludibacteraceae bacterium]HPH62474.1 agmatine deiminase family protein [Paludibacteraceae bacterium]HQF49868.1 agmatine deiminase family protein [Paludibacteraceae bacterium]HQJ89948.1 agmatine deiminase family protein [Paludibacteraceae bacterium]
MSIEFWIGTIIGLIGIIPIGLSFYHWLKKTSVVDLMKRLTDRSLSSKEHKNILRKINRRILREGKHLSSEYIKNFVLADRGRESVFTDMCIKNNWEPTKDLCISFLECDYPSVRKKFYQIKGTPMQDNSQPVEEEIKVDSGSKFINPSNEVVYVSELLEKRFPTAFKNLMSVLDKYGVEYYLLKGTKDIWCKDYMPIQTTSGKLIQFRYDPSYLKGNKEWEESRSDVKEVCRMNGLEPIFSNINLDGGNVLLCDGRAIISDRIFKENPEYEDKEQLKKELSELFEAEIIIIPAQNGDYTGHADGMVRFVDRDTILGNNRVEEYKYWTTGIEKVLNLYALKYIDVPFFTGYKNAKHPSISQF